MSKRIENKSEKNGCFEGYVYCNNMDIEEEKIRIIIAAERKKARSSDRKLDVKEHVPCGSRLGACI